MMIQTEHIRKCYGRKEVLRDVSFTAEAGEIVAIAGPNGCGKSTLLSILAGHSKAQAGTVRLNGAGTAYVPQENPLIEELTVKDNLSLWYAGSERDMKQDLEEGVLKKLGIGDFLKKRVSRLSGGMKKKVSIACAVARGASVLILDEPGAAIDLPGKQDIIHYMEEFAAGGGIVILSTHEEAELNVCHKIYVLKDGVLTQTEQGITAGEIAERYF